MNNSTDSINLVLALWCWFDETNLLTKIQQQNGMVNAPQRDEQVCRSRKIQISFYLLSNRVLLKKIPLLIRLATTREARTIPVGQSAGRKRLSTNIRDNINGRTMGIRRLARMVDPEKMVDISFASMAYIQIIWWEIVNQFICFLTIADTTQTFITPYVDKFTFW